MMEKLLVILLCLPLFCNGQASDQTLQSNVNGEDVVNAVIEKINSKCILPDDKYLMRRIAAVDTDYGRNSSPGTGGIWKVTNSILVAVKILSQGRLRSISNDIIQAFQFDLTKATMTKMNIPLYSALVMHAYVSSLPKVPASKNGQAVFWSRYIRPKGSRNDFIAKSSINISCSAVKMELVFAIDASGSVGSANFQKTLNFLQSVVNNLQIASDLTRVAVIRFATISSVSFHLDTYNSVSDITSAIANIRYTGGGTATDIVLDKARTSVFTKARNNVPKVFVLITDGYSNSRSRTVAAADRLKNNATIFTIGVGNVNPYEMRAVASSPSCTHYFSLSNYNEIDAIINEIQRESCAVPVAVDITNAVVNETVIENNIIPTDNKTKIQNINVEPDKTPSNSRNTTNIKVDVICGSVNIYASLTFNKPSAALYTYKAIATHGKPGWIRSPADQKLYLSLFSQRRWDLAISACTKPHYNISFNPPDEGVTIICRENGIERKCTPDDIKLSFGPLCDDDNVPNPCTKNNILSNQMRFKHPKSLTKYIQCKHSGEMEIVKCPKGKQYDESQSVCGPHITGLPTNSVLYNGTNPCTRQAIKKRQFYFANPLDKSTFIQCNEWGTAFLVNCPVNTIWSQQAYTCVHYSNAVSPSSNPCNSTHFYHENPSNRKSFIQCDESGNAYIMPCPLGTVWSQAALTCVHDSISLGLSLSLSSPPTTTTTPPPPTTTTTPPPTTPSCTVGDFFPHSNPHKFYQCNAGRVKIEMTCPSVLVWSQNKGYCDWP